MLAGGVPPCAVSPLVVFPPAVFGGCAPSGLPMMLSVTDSDRCTRRRVVTDSDRCTRHRRKQRRGDTRHS